MTAGRAAVASGGRGIRSEHAVVIAGGGPTGLMLAGELALAAVDVLVVERRAGQEVDGSRAGGLHARTIEVLDQRGIADRFLAEGRALQIQSFAGMPLDISDLPTRHPYGLALWQAQVERILAGWVAELGVPVAHAEEVVGFSQDDAGVEVRLGGGRTVRAQYLVGCDGGRSVVRRAAGIDFAGTDPSTSWLIAEVEMDDEPVFGLRPGGGIGRAADAGRVRVVLREPHPGPTDPTLEDVRAALVAADGTDYGARHPTWISRFTDATRQAVAYRAGRVLLAGDAAHVHPPQGGQGLNTGVQDAVNLGWKLARVVHRTSPERLLDTYHAERHPVGAQVLRTSLAQRALDADDERTAALRQTVAVLAAMGEPRRHLGAMVSGLGLRYDLGDRHPLVGRRMPDLDVETAEGPERVFTLLHAARPLLLDFRGPGPAEPSPVGHRVRHVRAAPTGGWELPVVGEVDAPAAVLVRPDGHVAWAGELDDAELPDALTTWFGPP